MWFISETLTNLAARLEASSGTARQHANKFAVVVKAPTAEAGA
jgi:hypothetical protein